MKNSKKEVIGVKKRFIMVEGSFHGTNDDMVGRWYIIDSSIDIIDKSGGGISHIDAVKKVEKLNKSEKV